MVPQISMAMLQGFLLRYKNGHETAIRDVEKIMGNTNETNTVNRSRDNNSDNLKSSAKTSNINGRKLRTLTISEVDKMYFNPQEGWDKDIISK